jgi:hypothetical protein
MDTGHDLSACGLTGVSTENYIDSPTVEVRLASYNYLHEFLVEYR